MRRYTVYGGTVKLIKQACNSFPHVKYERCGIFDQLALQPANVPAIAVRYTTLADNNANKEIFEKKICKLQNAMSWNTKTW